MGCINSCRIGRFDRESRVRNNPRRAVLDAGRADAGYYEASRDGIGSRPLRRPPRKKEEISDKVASGSKIGVLPKWLH
jgi:hypothetical protein